MTSLFPHRGNTQRVDLSPGPVIRIQMPLLVCTVLYCTECTSRVSHYYCTGHVHSILASPLSRQSEASYDLAPRRLETTSAQLLQHHTLARAVSQLSQGELEQRLRRSASLLLAIVLHAGLASRRFNAVVAA